MWHNLICWLFCPLLSINDEQTEFRDFLEQKIDSANLMGSVAILNGMCALCVLFSYLHYICVKCKICQFPVATPEATILQVLLNYVPRFSPEVGTV